MLLSMTGFGKAVVETADKKITVEIKSLNSKQLDLSVRLPGAYRDKELELRNIAARRIERGKADMAVSVESLGSDLHATLNTPVIKAYHSQIVEAARELGVEPPADWFAVILRLPDVFRADNDETVCADEAEALFKATSEAVERLMEYRSIEGKKLETFFMTRIGRIAELLKSIDPFERERVEKIRLRIEDGLRKLPGVEVDKGRLEQEMIFYIEKLDVNEEKQRLAQHLAYFEETLMLPTPGQGKKLGFIAQEMGREINTLGSKSNHADMQRIVVKMKDELEQIKEQVLNVM